MHLHSQAVQVVGRENRPKVRAVAIDRTVLHEAIGKKRFLAGANILASENRLPRFGDDAGGNRRTFAINANREVSQDCKTDNEGEDNALDPPRRAPPSVRWLLHWNPREGRLSGLTIYESIRLLIIHPDRDV
jgi:hypothetical protein